MSDCFNKNKRSYWDKSIQQQFVKKKTKTKKQPSWRCEGCVLHLRATTFFSCYINKFQIRDEGKNKLKYCDVCCVCVFTEGVQLVKQNKCSPAHRKRWMLSVPSVHTDAGG